MRLEKFHDRFHNDITVRTFFRLIPETEKERGVIDEMVSLMMGGNGGLQLTGIEESPDGGAGATFWVKWR
jgi:hypothetical protein